MQILVKFSKNYHFDTHKQRAVIFCLFTCFVLLFTSFTSPFTKMSSLAEGEILAPPAVYSESAVLIDADTGQIIFEKDKDKQDYPASTTKIMTALLAVEHLKPEQIITVDAISGHEIGSKIYVKEGELLSVEALLYATLLPSANDAAAALGIAISGDTPKFAELMNKRAKELGANNTNFVNPNGLPDPNHKTTALDLALIAKEAMKHEEIRKIVATYEYTIAPTNLTPESRLIHNTNQFLYNQYNRIDVYGKWEYIKREGITGIKTGYTDVSGRCLISSMKRGDTELIAVTMRANNYVCYADCASLFEYGFTNFTKKLIAKKGDEVHIADVIDGDKKKVKLTLSKDFSVLVEKGLTDTAITTEASLDKKINAPVKKGDELGKLIVYKDKQQIASTPIIADEDISVSEAPVAKAVSVFARANNILKIIIAVVVLIVILLAIFIAKDNMARRRRKRDRMLRRANRDASNIKFIKSVKKWKNQ